MKLHARKETVDLARVGLQGGIYTGFTTLDVRALEDAVIRYGLAEALLDGVAPTEEGLAVRDVFPDLDLRDQNGAAITKREWRQPWSGSYNTEEAEKQIYKTTRDSDNDKKVFIFYGARLTAVGNSVTTTRLNSSAIIWKRGNNVKVIDAWHLELMDAMQDPVVYARTPLMYKRGDHMRVDFYPKTGASGSADTLILLGKTVEPLSLNVTG